MVSDDLLDRPTTQAVAVDHHDQLGSFQEVGQRGERSKRSENLLFRRVDEIHLLEPRPQAVSDQLSLIVEIDRRLLTPRLRQLREGVGDERRADNRQQRLGKEVGQRSQPSPKTGSEYHRPKRWHLQLKTISFGAVGFSRRCAW